MPLTDEMRAAIAALNPKPTTKTEISRPIDAWRKGHFSQAAGCHPTQVEEFNGHLEKAGITRARFLSDGTLYTDNRETRKQVHEIWGYYDRDAGYKDRC